MVKTIPLAVARAQSLLVTIFNAGMALGSAMGGAVLAGIDSTELAWLSFGVYLLIFAALSATPRHALPAQAANFDTEEKAA